MLFSIFFNVRIQERLCEFARQFFFQFASGSIQDPSKLLEEVCCGQGWLKKNSPVGATLSGHLFLVPTVTGYFIMFYVYALLSHTAIPMCYLFECAQ